MRPTIPAAALVALVLALPGPAAAFIARNGLVVYPTAEPGVMEVLGRAGSAGPEFFCAAGEYARGPLRARATDRVVVVRPVERSAQYNGRRTVLFAVVPAGARLPDRSGILLDVDVRGENRTVAHAQFLCNSEDRRGGFFG